MVIVALGTGRAKFGSVPSTLMDQHEYEAFVAAARGGSVRIGIDRVFARRLYTNVPGSVILEATGETPLVEKSVVWSAMAGSPLLVLGSAAAASFAFGWWAAAVVPLTLAWWLLNKSLSVRGGAKLWPLTVCVVVATAVHFFAPISDPWASGFIVLFALALWSDRLVYSAATFFLRAFVLRNRRALEAFSEGFTIRA